MAEVISILNYKGGVAKTTTTLNLGTAFWLLGKKVLLIDTDSQINLSSTLGFSQREGDDTSNEWLLHEDVKAPIYARYNGLHYIPGSENLATIEAQLLNRRNREKILTKKLEAIKSYYDYILIDCAPKEGTVNDNAMTASDKVIIPVECSGFSLQGMQKLLYTVNDVKENINPNLDILGFLLVKYDSKTLISRQVSKYIETNKQAPLLESRIRKCVKFDETPISKKSIFEHAPESNGAEDYLKLAEEISKIKRPKNWRDTIDKAWREFSETEGK